MFVQDDAVVEAGDPLFALDDQPFELARRQAEANLSTAVQTVDASSASLAAAQAAVTQARANLENARAQTNRSLRLVERGIASAARGDTARAELSDAEAGLATAEANLESAQAQLGPQGQTNPEIQTAQAQLEQAQYGLASTVVRAPHFGVVTNVQLADGQFLGAGSPALTFIDTEAAWITVDLRENQLQFITAGDPVTLLFDALPGKIFEGHVQSVAWGINPGRSAQDGLIINAPATRWFEPARRMPVRIELSAGMDSWPIEVRVGGKVHAIVYAGGVNNPISWIARISQRVRSFNTYLN